MKAVLVLGEMPKCCDECQLNYDMGIDCDAMPMEIETAIDKREMHNEDKRPLWCPLKEMPSKIVCAKSDSSYTRGYIKGFNYCIEELEK